MKVCQRREYSASKKRKKKKVVVSSGILAKHTKRPILLAINEQNGKSFGRLQGSA
jgi:hypothetical protein